MSIRYYLYGAGYTPAAMKEKKKDGTFTTYFFLTNTHGDVVALQDQAGRVMNRYAYGPWGEPTRVSELIHQPFRYAGYLYDPTTELYYLKARWYDPGTGRFLSRDDFKGFANILVSLNRYSYSHSNTPSLVDPMGLSPRRPRVSKPARDSKPVLGCQEKLDPPPWELLYGVACPPRGFTIVFYMPKFSITQAGWRMLKPYGECSWAPDGFIIRGLFFDFANACKTHDYGYDLARYGELRGPQEKAEVDNIFLADMYADCAPRGGFEADNCRIIARLYWSAVSTWPLPPF